jgi:uncharacterized membrane protein
MDLYPWLKFGHVLGAVLYLGGGVMLSLAAARARQSDDPNAAAAELSRMVAYAGPRAILPAFLAVVGFGVWMVLISAAWEVTQLWVLLGLGLFVLAFLVGMLYQGRISRDLRRAVETGSPAPADTRAMLGRWILGQSVVVLILVVAVWDMIFKPGLGA